MLAAHGVEVVAYTVALGGVGITRKNLAEIAENRLFCPDNEAAVRMEERISAVREQGDSLGGIVEITARGCKAGLGEPVFDKLDAALARGLMSIGAVKGVEIGAGFAAADSLGSENNDPITPTGFAANRAGGILAGISNGDDIVARVAVKPIPSINQDQDTVDLDRGPRQPAGHHPDWRAPRYICHPTDSAGLRGHGLPDPGRLSIAAAGRRPVALFPATFISIIQLCQPRTSQSRSKIYGW
jgi:chorismate synthase